VLDLTCICLTAPAWLPLMIFAVLFVKMVSRGPVFYRQQRIGLGGRRFTILKFRSMKVNAETRSHEGYFQKLVQADCPMRKLDESGDSRMIPGGRLFRATGLDELPQLFNVIWGDMSLVGPRPCTPNEFACYSPEQAERVLAAPGLTGLWQVSGKNNTTFSRMIELDLSYARSMSVLSDLKIIAKTIPAIAKQVGESQRKRRHRKDSERPLEVNSTAVEATSYSS
jgi:lipopolysaccharide/colanic/teichoic acid biosynthesis glycosyltransferase